MPSQLTTHQASSKKLFTGYLIMPLTLQVTTYNNIIPDIDRSIIVDMDTCTIGRSAKSDFELLDIECIISHHHATIYFEEKNYFLTDYSTNGVYINNASEPIGQGNKIQLKNNDQISMGNYICTISIDSPSIFTQKPSLHNAQWQLPGQENRSTDAIDKTVASNFVALENMTATLQHATEQDHLNPPDALSEDWDTSTELFQTEAYDSLIYKSVETPELTTTSQTSTLHSLDMMSDAINSDPVIRENITTTPQHATEQDCVNPSNAIPEDWNASSVLITETQESQTSTLHSLNLMSNVTEEETLIPESSKLTSDILVKTSTQTYAPTKTPEYRDAIHAFLSGAGISDIQLEQDAIIPVMHTAGKVLRESIDGLRKMLLSRNNLKGDFRLGMTLFQPTQNNPIKFSLDAEDALTKLLSPTAKGYMPPINAVHDVTDDLQAHQTALLSGSSAALSSLIEKFNPEAFEENLDSSSTIDKVIPSLKKARYWEQFKVSYKETAADTENDFLHFLEKEFTLAYEQQIKAAKLNRQ